jgi:hypothetical protein
MSRDDNDLIALAFYRARKELGRDRLDLRSDVMPYLTEHKAELSQALEEMNMFRRRLLLDEIEKKQTEISVIEGLLKKCD